MRKVLIDCRQEIPCDPCRFSCRYGAITLDSLTAIPQVDESLCIGCSLCVAACPGQACFVVDDEYSDTMASVDLPYEYLPYPAVGENWLAVNNDGEVLCTGEILRAIHPPSFHNTAVITVAVPKQYAYTVRGLRHLE